MESIIAFVCEHAHHAPWILFSLLLLSGLNIPISEDILLLSAGAIASRCIPEHTLWIFFWVLMGCYLSAWEAYWIGRLLGPKLYRIRLFSRVMTPERLNWLRHYYSKYGIFTFIVGRFCPGGIRNALFISSGLTKMPFNLFVLRDGLAAFISCNVYFYIGYAFAANIESLKGYIERYTIEFFIFLGCILLIWAAYYWYKKKLNSKNGN